MSESQPDRSSSSSSASVGSAIVGTHFATRLTHLLTGALGTGGTGDPNALTPTFVRPLPATAHDLG